MKNNKINFWILKNGLLLGIVLKAIFLPTFAGVKISGMEDSTEKDFKYRLFAIQLEKNLKTVLEAWFPLCIDKEFGGYHQDFKYNWERGDSKERMLVFQTRMLWMASQVMIHFEDLREEYREYVYHGFRYLRDFMWDQEHGGFYFRMDVDGNLIGSSQYDKDEKHAYPLSFAIYALADAYRATQDDQILQMAIETFEWLDEKGHDKNYGGYFEAFERDGTKILEPKDSKHPFCKIVDSLYGSKTMNTQIHLLESFTALATVTKHKILHNRLRELHSIVLNKICVSPGAMNLYFNADWSVMPDHNSFGHNVETAFLLTESAKAIGISGDPKTIRMSRDLIDHSILVGWDVKNHGLMDSGGVTHANFERDKIWWVQAENLNALLLMHSKYNEETGKYWKLFVEQWNFIDNYLLDHENGGWHLSVAENGALNSKQDKCPPHGWKACYHNGRALIHCIQTLHSLAKQSLYEN